MHPGKALRRSSDYLTHPVFHELSLRDRDAALSALAGGQGHRPRPGDDPAGLLHHEAQRHHRDDADHLARVPACIPSRRSSRPQGYQELFEELEDMLCEVTGFRRRLAAAQRRLPGRVRGPSW